MLIVTPFEVFVLSIAQVVVEFTSNAVPSIVNVPSMSVLSRLAVPSTARSPVTLRLSLTVVSEVACPIEIGTALVAVPTVIPFVVFELSILRDVVASNDIVVPSTANVPSTSVLSRLAVPFTSRSVPTYNFLAMLAPPSVRSAPVSPVALLESVAIVISSTPDVVIAPQARVPIPLALLLSSIAIPEP